MFYNCLWIFRPGDISVPFAVNFIGLENMMGFFQE
jgi:hypothetical protein